MSNSPPVQRKNRNHAVWLYSIVYGRRFSVLAVLLLLISFFVQPFHEAYAAEEEVVEPEPEVVAEDVREQTDIPEEEVDEEPLAPEPPEELWSPPEEDELEEFVEVEPIDDDEAAESVTETEWSIVEPEESEGQEVLGAATSSAVEDDDETTTSTTETGSDETEDETSTSTASSTPESTEDTPTETEESAATGGGGGGGGGSSSQDDTESTEETEPGTESGGDEVEESGSETTDEQSEENQSTESEVATTTATTTEEVVNEAIDIGFSISEDNFYQFSKQSCVAVGSGAYHCSDSSETRISEGSTVFADLGESQNLEIFLETADGDLEQLTDNLYDDTAPHFDPVSMRVVWQRLIEGRYQIIVYDLEERKETQLTFSRTNNMEPKVSEDGIVWQAWDNNDWEIMFFDGAYTDQITDNFAQDVTPVIQDKYVLWTVLGESEQQAKVYSLEAKEVVTIQNHDGGRIANPRFVLVYDTQFENGDIITQGFDPETGLSKPISAQPGPQPVNIPDADSTGEVRAMIQNKTSSKESQVETEDEPDEPVTASSTPGTLDVASSTDMTLSIPTTTAPVINDISTTTPDTPPEEVATSTRVALDEFDLVITPEGDASTSTDDSVQFIEPVASTTQQERR